ncbi:DciA family protein [Candidatus Haliotispira prima]|uniref:DciA family protein n=1 Tax=Candidatus Haliotispira prima TaxID=3034016 RepID=A0ABY8MIF4_9SPIO|nr:DciA family protein [Candidatus Haliotispira prima]
MKNAKDLLEQFLRENEHISKQIEEKPIDVFGLWPQVLNDLGFHILAQNSQVIELERKHLLLSVRHSVFLQELTLQQNQWLPAFEAALKQCNYPNHRIQKVNFRVKT